MKYLLLSIFTLLSIAGFSQPQCNTQGVTGITTSSAVLHYSAAANFVTTPVSIIIDYSLSSSFVPQTSTTVAAIVGNQTVNSTLTINGLVSNKLYHWRVRIPSISICNGADFTTAAGSTAPVINSLIDATPAIDSAVISYGIYAGNNNTTSIIRYGLSSTTLTSQVTGGIASGTTLTNINTTINGLLPNTKYYYQIEATNIVGTVSSAISTFITDANAVLINEFKFNNSRYDETNTIAFVGFGGYTTDRNGNANSAKICDPTLGIADTASIPNLPQGGTARSISMWFKRTNNSATTAYPFLYGSNASYQLYGYGVSTTTSTMFFYHPTGLDPTVTYSTNNTSWYHIVMTSTNNGLHKLYINGVLINNPTLVINTTGTLFKIGHYNFAGAVDDLKIYSGVLTPTQVTQLYNNNVLPTTITQFAAIKKDNTAQLNWTSENEINVSHFNIQRSTNGKDFETIANVSAGKSSYELIDGKLPITNEKLTLNYRLQIVDKDGSKTYSAIKQIILNQKQQTVNIFPTIATSKVNIGFESNKSQNVSFKIIDAKGQVIDTKNVHVLNGTNNFYYDCSKLNKGIYFINFSNNSEFIKTENFYKQ